MTTKRKGHPNSRPLPGPAAMPGFAEAAGNLIVSTVQVEVMRGATPQAALLAGARELIRHAEALERAFSPDGGPRFTETR